MSIRADYNDWSAQYDTNANRTRDREAAVLREVLRERASGRVLEIGCGTGKNTVWLAERAAHVTAVDLSEGMLDQARRKVTGANVRFVQADILKPWDFRDGEYDLVTFSLVLEHIDALDPIFQEAARSLVTGGAVYVGELHPFKQYAGTQARFTTVSGTRLVTCFIHNLSDFLRAAEGCELELEHLGEHFDAEPGTPPRILSLLFRKG